MTSIVVAFCMALTISFLSYLNRQANKGKVAGDHEFKMPKAYLFMGYLMILISLGILIVPQLMENPPEYYHPFVWFLIILIFLFGIYIIRLQAVHKITVDHDEFVIHSSFGQKKTFKINGINSLNISHTTYFITIQGDQGQKGQAYFHLQGLITLLREIRTKSGRDISDIESVLKM